MLGVSLQIVGLITEWNRTLAVRPHSWWLSHQPRRRLKPDPGVAEGDGPFLNGPARIPIPSSRITIKSETPRKEKTYSQRKELYHLQGRGRWRVRWEWWEWESASSTKGTSRQEGKETRRVPYKELPASLQGTPSQLPEERAWGWICGVFLSVPGDHGERRSVDEGLLSSLQHPWVPRRLREVLLRECAIPWAADLPEQPEEPPSLRQIHPHVQESVRFEDLRQDQLTS